MRAIVFQLLKDRVGISTNSRDPVLYAIIDGILDECENVYGIHITEERYDHILLDRNLTPSIANNTISIENINAGEFLYSTYSPKQIVMEFQIANSTARELSEFRRRMAEILHSDEPKRLIFSYEPTIYYDAIVDGEPVLEEDDMYSSGSITWLIPDGVAYSTAEFTFDGVQKDGYQTITIQNNGTEWADVDYEIAHQHENGFIGLVSQYGVIQLGKQEEADGENYEASEEMVNG